MATKSLREKAEGKLDRAYAILTEEGPMHIQALSPKVRIPKRGPLHEAFYQSVKGSPRFERDPGEPKRSVWRAVPVAVEQPAVEVAA